MSERRSYRGRPGQPVVAVQLKLDTEGFKYTMWGEEQRCKANDWLVDNNGNVYSVDPDSFARTYTTTMDRALFITATFIVAVGLIWSLSSI